MLEGHLYRACHRVHMEYQPRNYRISLPINDWELPLSDQISDENPSQMFKTHCVQFRKRIKRIIGDEILYPNARGVIFPSQVISTFLSNSIDLFQSFHSLQIIAEKVIKEVFIQENRLLSLVQAYDLWQGQGRIGALFPRYFLLNVCISQCMMQ